MPRAGSPTADAGGPSAAPAGVGLPDLGLPVPVLAVITGFSVVVFLTCPGALWGVTPGTSHAGRIAVSYLIVIPVVTILLRWNHRLDPGRLAGCLALIWAAKLVITSTLYFLLAPEVASRYSPARAWQEPTGSREPRLSSRYRMAPTTTGLTDLCGVVTARGAPVRNAVVLVLEPGPGRPLPPARDVIWSLRKGLHDRPVRLVWKTDRIRIVNHDTELHTVRIAHREHTLSNVPAIPGVTGRTIPVPPAGIYEIRCDNHPGERASLVVAGHPYATETDGTGRFDIQGVPCGVTEVLVVRASGPPVMCAVTISPCAHPEVLLDVAAGAGPEGGAE